MHDAKLSSFRDGALPFASDPLHLFIAVGSHSLRREHHRQTAQQMPLYDLFADIVDECLPRHLANVNVVNVVEKCAYLVVGRKACENL